MPTYKKADDSVAQMAREILAAHECYQPVLDARTKIDFVFAFPDLDEDGKPTNDSITLRGQKCLGVCRGLPLKDRAMGRGDAEITLDADFWAGATPDEARALLDHELYHIQIKMKGSIILKDDLERPKIKMRKHDMEVGWFKAVADRNGVHSQEQIQAKKYMDEMGQFFWPELSRHL